MLSSLVLQLVVAFMMAHHNSALFTGATGSIPPAPNFRAEPRAKVSRATRQQKPIETTCNLLETIRVGTRHSTMKPARCARGKCASRRRRHPLPLLPFASKVSATGAWDGL